jgi:hypothetical protein
MDGSQPKSLVLAETITEVHYFTQTTMVAKLA